MLFRKSLSLATAAVLALAVFAALIATAHASSATAPSTVAIVSAVQYTSGLSQPVDIANTGIATDTRLFVVERAGLIRVVTTSNGVTGTVLGTNFLDIDAIVDSATHGEMGLLGMAFSPNYASDGQFYVYYNRNADNIHVARYTVSANPNVANPSGTVIMTITHNTENNHNGGDLAFGPDDYLYLAPGDGGNTPQLAQNVTNPLGKVLRIAVIGETTYAIPASNPYTITNPYTTTAARGEIWAIGLRNPFRFSFDRLTGDMYIADVGQNNYEEVNFQPAGVAGLNYGWRCYEGTHTYNTTGCGPIGDFTMPKAEYCHPSVPACPDDGGESITGGFVYRGPTYPNLSGYYFYADFVTSRFWAMQSSSPWTVTPLPISNVTYPSSFGEDVNGELYVSTYGTGRLYRLVGNAAPPPIQTPLWLPHFRR